MATAPAASASPHQHGHAGGPAAHARGHSESPGPGPDRSRPAPHPQVHAESIPSEQWHPAPPPRPEFHPAAPPHPAWQPPTEARPAEGAPQHQWHAEVHQPPESHGDRQAHHRSAEFHGRSAPTSSNRVSSQSLMSAATPAAAPTPVPQTSTHRGDAGKQQSNSRDGAHHPATKHQNPAIQHPAIQHPATQHPATQNGALQPAANSAPAPTPSHSTVTHGQGPGVHAASLTGSAPALQASGLLVPSSVSSPRIIVAAAPSPVPAQFFGPSSGSHHSPVPAVPSSPGATRTPASHKSASGTVPGAFGEPMILAQGAWHGLSLRAATDLQIPIGLLVAVGVFLLVQALVDRRDPKVTAAPERGTDDTIGFQ